MTTSLPAVPRSRPSSGGHLRALVLAAAIACVAAPHGARASGMPVIDAINWIQNYLQQYQSSLEFVREGKRWYDTVMHMRQQLIALQGLATTGIVRGQTFELRAETHGVAQDCPGDGPLSLSSLLRWVVPDYEGKIVDQQQKLCVQIAIAHNKKWNEMVKVMKKVEQMQDEWEKVSRERMDQVGSSEGALAANENNTSRFMSQLSQDLAYWQTADAAYDSYIGLLKQEQQRLARAAMGGKKTIVGSVVQGAVLKGALQVARGRDR